MRYLNLRVLACGIVASCWLTALAEESVLRHLPATPTRQVSTVPPNGDINPYGVAIVPPEFRGSAALHTGDILVSNFNNVHNFQGTGSTIVRITPSGHSSVFFQGPLGVGLTTALGILRDGFVVVGNVPTTDGTFGTIGQGSLLILDNHGNVVSDLTSATLLDGPWDLAIHDMGHHAQLFVSNVLSGTVTRIDLTLGSGVAIAGQGQIASGYTHHSDPAALVVGPTGMVFDHRTGSLFIASTGDNAIYSIPHAATATTDAGIGNLVYSDNTHLHGPLGLVLAPNGNFIATNGDAVNSDPSQPSEMVEFTRAGTFVAQVPVNSTGQGGAFGIAVAGTEDRTILVVVDDILNAVDVWVVHEHGHDHDHDH